MRILTSLIILSFIFSPLNVLKANAGVYNKLQQVGGTIDDDSYFDTKNEELSEEEKALEEALAAKEAAELAAKEKAKLEAEAKAAKEAAVLEAAQDIRDQEIDVINEKFQDQKIAAELDKDKCGFFCKVWKVITYPVRKVASIF
ncbi:MAG: hypothetical protein HRT47_02930 [Candidatus Caenarcaniphilales bacterium]|nr:hypothetical protein [Candidatus Caenarcaniphilales bacterium]